MNAARTQSARGGWRADAAIVLLLLAGWIGFVSVVTGGHRVVMYDTFRDMAWAENMRAGRIWSDPVIAGQPYWYAPGNPLLVAAVARLTGRSVIDLYGYGAFWINAFIPLLLYVLVRVVWDRVTALIALPVVFLGSFWWLTHAVSGIPGIQGVAFNLVGLLCWHRCVVTTRTGPRAAWAWPLLTGAVLALSTWHHPLCGVVLAGAIFLHAATDAVLPSGGLQPAAIALRERLAVFRRMLLVALVALGLTLPLIVRMLAWQARSATLLHFFAPELIERDFYAHAQTPLVVPFALVGIWFIARRAPHALWAVTYLLVGLLGQAAGYLAHIPGWYVPHLLPHEFQWHGQLALGICAAVGIVGAARALAERLAAVQRRPVASGLLCLLLCTLAVGPGLRRLPRAGEYLLDLESPLARTRGLRAWIQANTSLDDTFVCPRETAYQVVSGLTGRKCIAVSPGHTNPGVNLRRRLADLRTMLETTDAETFARLARHYGAGYLLLPLQSPEDEPTLRARYAAWPCLELVFVPEEHNALVYRIH